MEVTKKFAEYVTTAGLEDFPPEAVAAAKAAIIDCLGCMLAGSKEPLADVLCEYVGGLGGTPSATVVGRGFKTSTPEAALINGAMSHALDYDDVTFITKTHPSAVLIPAALPLAEEVGATGGEMLLAYLLGFEVACAVGDAISPAYYDDLGWHPTGPLGTLGAAAAASRLLGLDAGQTAMAISLAASQAAGLRQNFGTMTKPYHAGAACRSGITAAKLVRAGFTASADALEGRFGFMRAFSGGSGYDPEKAAASIGNRCYMVESGIEIKKYPCCGSAHLALDATAKLLAQETFTADQVDHIDVLVDFDPPRSLIHSRPTGGLEGKFSMQYCLAAEILDGANRAGELHRRAGGAPGGPTTHPTHRDAPPPRLRGPAQLDRSLQPGGGPHHGRPGPHRAGRARHDRGAARRHHGRRAGQIPRLRRRRPD